MLRCFPRLRRAGRLLLPGVLALATLGAAPAAACGALAAAQLELATWVGGLDSAPAGLAATAAFPQAEAWLRAPTAGPDQELARRLCRSRYAALAALGEAFAVRQAAGDASGAAALYGDRILPLCFEIAVCLRAAAAPPAGGAP